MKTKTLLLIDGDQFIFKATAALEQETRWDDDLHVLWSDPIKCWDNLQGMIKRIFERFEHSQHALCFSSPRNFRKEIDPTYKSGRSPRKPMCYSTLREQVEGSYNCIAMDGLEADDVMGILATKPGPLHKIIVSQDKDMKTIPAHVWDGEDLHDVSVEAADRFHIYQTLIGDTSDGYPGCPGLGDVGATEFLNDPYTLEAYEHALKSGPRKGTTEQRWRKVPLTSEQRVWDGVVSLYAAKGLTEEDALRQARLARILRWSDWNTETKQPILWSPRAN